MGRRVTRRRMPFSRQHLAEMVRNDGDQNPLYRGCASEVPSRRVPAELEVTLHARSSARQFWSSIELEKGPLVRTESDLGGNAIERRGFERFEKLGEE